MVDSPGMKVPPPRPADVRRAGPKTKLARHLPKPIHYALAGGGSHGAVQWGLLQALAETDLVPADLIGTSAGALTGSVYAEDPATANARLSYIWGQLGTQNLIGEWSLPRQLVSNARQMALLTNEAALRTFDAIYTADTFEDLEVPFGAVATDLSTGRATVIDSGDLRAALLASSAIPGVMPPVEIDGRLYCDGLASANVPAALAVERGAGSVVVLGTGFRDQAPVSTTPTKITGRVAAILNNNQRDWQLAEAAEQVPVIVLPTPGGLGSTMDFRGSMTAAAAAHMSAREYLNSMAQTWRGRLRPGLYGPEPPGTQPDPDHPTSGEDAS